MTIFVRFAPSPTGLLHVGNIRTALYNYLFARANAGRFLLRIDDTDQERSTREYEDAIQRDLKWLGLKWDCTAKQSERSERYFEVIEKLKQSGRVYPCFESQAELDLKRKTQLGRGLPPVYDRAALKLSESERAALIAQGHKPHWRFKLEHRDVVWDDLIQKHKVFPTSSLSDPVLVREDGVPLYSICSVIDDADMGITHIIRGEDHVTNTAAQIQMWEAVSDKPVPAFAHFPLLVSADGREMSKRLGTMSIASMRNDDHIEPMAINSLLAKLGTSDPIAPFGDIETLAASFDLGKISRATPKFDLEELRHLNAKLLHITPFAEVKERLGALGLGPISEAFWLAVRPNLATFEDVRFWWQITYAALTPADGGDPAFLARAAKLLPEGALDLSSWGLWTNAIKAETGLKGKELFQPLRLALTGADHGPEMKTLLPLIGREKVLARLAGETA